MSADAPAASPLNTIRPRNPQCHARHRPLDPETMNPLQKAMVQGIQYSRLMEGGQAATLTELAAQLGGERTFIYHSLELVNLAPDIQKAVIGGRIPDGFTLAKLRKGIPDT